MALSASVDTSVPETNELVQCMEGGLYQSTGIANNNRLHNLIFNAGQYYLCNQT